MDAPSLVPVEDAAPQLMRHKVTLRKNLRDGSIPGIKVGGRWYISSAVLDRIKAGEPMSPRADAAKEGERRPRLLETSAG